MILGLLIALSTICGVLVSRASRPATATSRERSAARRAKFVATHPTQVNEADIVATLRSEGLHRAAAQSLALRARQGGITPFTMWLWCEQFDAESLGVVVAADLTHQELLTHIGHRSLPNMSEARLFASANGWESTGSTQDVLH